MVRLHSTVSHVRPAEGIKKAEALGIQYKSLHFVMSYFLLMHWPTHVYERDTTKLSCSEKAELRWIRSADACAS